MNKFADKITNTEDNNEKIQFKKITAIAMCGVLTVGSVLMTGAVSEYENHKDFEVTGTTQKNSNNQLFCDNNGDTLKIRIKISVQSSYQRKGLSKAQRDVSGLY